MITSVRTCANRLFCPLQTHGKSPSFSRSRMLGRVDVVQAGLVFDVVDVGVSVG